MLFENIIYCCYNIFIQLYCLGNFLNYILYMAIVKYNFVYIRRKAEERLSCKYLFQIVCYIQKICSNHKPQSYIDSRNIFHINKKNYIILTFFYGKRISHENIAYYARISQSFHVNYVCARYYNSMHA